MEEKLSPFEIEILLWYYHSPNDFPNMDCPAFLMAMNKFINAGIFYKRLDQSTDKQKLYGYHHEALSVYINEITKIRLPKRTWTI